MRLSIYHFASLVVLLAVMVLTWSLIKPKTRTEVILFALVGHKPFQDSIFTIQPSGQRLEQLLAPVFDRSYIFASGTALRENFIVLVHEGASPQGVENLLYVFRPVSREWSKLTTKDYDVGGCMISPDRLQVVFNFTPKVKPPKQSSLPRLAIVDIKTEKIKEMDGEEGTWDSYPAWFPNGKEIVFIRSQRTSMGIKNKLMRASLADLTATLFLDEPVAGFCISPTGTHIAMVGKEGIEIIELSEMKRAVIIPWSKLLPDYAFMSGGMCWSRYENKIAIAIYHKTDRRHEIWIIDIERKTAESIYKSTKGRILISSFITTA